MKKLIAVGLLALAMAALLLGCGQAKLTSQEVKGGVTSLQMDLPFTLEQQPKEEAAKSNDYVKSITDSRVTQAKGMDFHLMQFTTYVMNADKMKSDAQSKAQFEQKALNGYLTAFEQNAKASENSRDTRNITVSGKNASVTTVQCKMKGEDETLKIIYINDPAESWLIALAYPKEKQDGIGRKIDETIIPDIKLVK